MENLPFIVYFNFTGIFITSEEEIFDNTNASSKVKSVLNYMHKVLNVNPHMYGNCTETNEKLVLHYSNKTVVCKSIEVNSAIKGLGAKPVDWKFTPKECQWQRLDTYYEFDEVYPVLVKKNGISVKDQFQVSFNTAITLHLSITVSITSHCLTGCANLQVMLFAPVAQ